MILHSNQLTDFKLSDNNNNASTPLPWWTWVVPFFIANLGTWLSLWFKTDPGVSLWYIPTALGIVMVYWWGPRALLGVYLNALVCTPLWDLPWKLAPLYALPETIEVGLSWLLFLKTMRSRSWLPDLKSVSQFLIFGSLLPATLPNVYLVVQLYLLNDIARFTVWSNWIVLFLADVASHFVIAVPVLILFTKFMVEKGWARVEGEIIRLPLLPDGRNSKFDSVTILLVFISIFFMAIWTSVHDYWIAYGLLMTVLAIRYGVNVAILASSWTGALAILLPPIMKNQLGLPTTAYSDVLAFNLDILFLCAISLLIGRAISDLSTEVSEHKQADQALRESEKKYRAIFENATEGIFQTAPDGRNLTANPAVARLLGYDSPNEYITAMPNVVAFYVDPARRAEFRKELETYGETRDFETQVYRKNGEQIWVSLNSHTVRDETDTVLYYEGFVRDITERKRAEEELRRSEEKFRQLITSAPDAIIGANQEGKIIFASVETTKLLGYELEELMSMNIEVLIPTRFREAHTAKYVGYMTNPHPRMRTGLELFAMCKDGSEVPVDISLSRLDTEAGPLVTAFIRDITVRKQAEDKLRASEGKIRAIFDTMSEGVALNEIIYNQMGEMIDYRILEVNQAYYSTADYIGDQVVGNLATRLYGMPLELIKEFWQAHKNRNDVTHIEYFSPLKNRHFFISTSPFINDRFVTSFFDITERKQAEQALQESEARYRAVVENQTEFIVRWKPDGTRTFVNDAYCRYFHLTQEEVNSSSFISLILEEDRSTVEEKMTRLVSGERDMETDTHRVIKPDGSVGWQEWTDQVIRDERGQVIEFQSVGRDVTERKMTEEALRESEEHYRHLAQATVEGIAIGGADGIFIDANPQCAQMFGYTLDEFLGMPIHRVVPPEDQERLAQILNSEQEDITEQRIIRKDGTMRIAEVHSLPTVYKGQAARVAAVHDITERKKTEQREAQRRLILEKIMTLAKTVTEVSDLQTTLQRIWHGVHDDLGFDRVAIFLYNPELNTIDGTFGTDLNGEMIEEWDYSRSLLQARQTSFMRILEKQDGLYFTHNFGVENQIPEGHEMFDVKDYAAVAAWAGNKPVAILCADNMITQRNIPEEQLEAIRLFAGYAGLAIENARLFEAEQLRRKEAETLRESLLSIVTTFEIEEVVERILDQIKFVIPYDTASVWRLEGDWQTIIVSRDLPPEFSPPDLRINIKDNNSSSQLFLEKKPYVLNNNVQEELSDFKGPHSYINSWLAVPLKKRGKIIGLIALDGKSKGQFTDHHAQLAVAFADQVAIALENASLYEEIQQELTERKHAEETLRQSEELYRRAIEAAGAVPYYQDYLTERYTFVGERIKELTGYSAAEITPSLYSSIVQESYMRGDAAHLSVLEAIQHARTGQLKVWQSDGKFLTREGQTRWIADSAVEILNQKGEAIGSIGILQDITERKRAEQEIQQLNAELENRVKERTAQLNEANQNLHQEKVRLEQYSRQRELMGTMTDLLQASLTTEEASGIVLRYMQLLFPNRDGALYLLNSSGTLEPSAVWGEQKSLDTMFGVNDCWALRRGKPYRFGSGSPNPPCAHVGKEISQSALCIPLTAQGESMGSLHISTENIGESGLIDDEEQRFIETITDSVALALANVRLREKLRIQSIRDGLTGLFNRRYLDETLPREIHRAERNQRPISVLMFDIDSFKKFNDTYGHDAGDIVLKRIAELILSKVRPSDIACRYGGEEFTIILPDTPLEIAQTRAESLREAASLMEVLHNGKNLGTITISVGIAAYPLHGLTRDILIKAADKASYQAKEAGKNRVFLASHQPDPQ